MKRDGDIASLFQKHAANKLTASSSLSPDPIAFVMEDNQGSQEKQS
jgi:hypothetical protein